MKATTQDVWALFTTHQFRIPLYQRHYNWTEPQCKALWDDFVRLCEEDATSHYLGTMVVEKESEDLFRIVDGQQRTTSLMLLFKALQGHFKEGEFRLLTNLRPASPRQSSTGTDGEARSRSELRLIPQGEGRSPSDFEHFNAVMANGARETRGIPLAGTFSQNLELFTKWLRTYQETPSNRSNLTFDKIRSSLTRMQIAFVELDRERDDKDDPQTIFEKMNAEGKDLEVHDLIRNYLFMLAAESKDDSRSEPSSASAKQQSLYVNEWQNFENEFPERAFHQMKHFFRDYLIIQTGDVTLTSGKELYVKFKERYSSGAQTPPSSGSESLSEFRGVEKLANDLWRHADAWGKVVFGSHIKGVLAHTGRLRQVLKEFGLIANAPYYPFATLLMAHGQDHQKLAELFEILNKFIAISRITDTDVHVPFTRRFLEPLLKRGSFSKQVEDFMSDPSALKEQLQTLWPDGFRPEASMRRALMGNWELETDASNPEVDIELGSPAQTQEQKPGVDEAPSLNTSENEGLRVANTPPDMYHREITTYLLLKINEKMMGNTGDTVVEYLQPSHSLEHIMPQTLSNAGWTSLDDAYHQEYLHCLGNLTLLGKGFNTKVYNRALEEKLPYYEDSSYAITRRLAKELGSQGAHEAGQPKEADLKKFVDYIRTRTHQLAEEVIAILQF